MTPSAAAVATAASTALPPLRRTRSPTRVAYGSTVDTAPPRPMAVGALGGSAAAGAGAAAAAGGRGAGTDRREQGQGGDDASRVARDAWCMGPPETDVVHEPFPPNTRAPTSVEPAGRSTADPARPLHGVPGAGEGAVAVQLDELQVELPREQRSTGTEGHRRDVEDQLVEQLRLRELCGEVAAADHPEVLAAGRLDHRGVHLGDVSLHEADVTVGLVEGAVGEDPAGHVVGPLLAGPRVVVEDPLVRRRAHRDRADALDEVAVVHRAALVLVLDEQPVEGVVLVGEVPVEGGGGVVDGAGHALSSVSSPIWLAQPVDGVSFVDLPAAGADELADQLPAGDGEGEHVRDDAAHHEALGRVAERVDQPVVPGAAALDVGHGRPPASGDVLVALDQRGRVVGPLGWELGALDGRQPDLLGEHDVGQHLRDRLVGAVEAEHRAPRTGGSRGSRRRAAAWRGPAGRGCRRGPGRPAVR